MEKKHPQRHSPRVSFVVSASIAVVAAGLILFLPSLLSDGVLLLGNRVRSASSTLSTFVRPIHTPTNTHAADRTPTPTPIFATISATVPVATPPVSLVDGTVGRVSIFGASTTPAVAVVAGFGGGSVSSVLVDSISTRGMSAATGTENIVVHGGGSGRDIDDETCPLVDINNKTTQ